jgi:glycosyltransferase involved in cell wall biosynthesis
MMNSLVPTPKDYSQLRDGLKRLRGNPDLSPSTSIVIPVNAQKDLVHVLNVALDIIEYYGNQSIEMILVINNYPSEGPPKEIEEYTKFGFEVLGIPNVAHHGGVALAARIPGIELARAETVLLFDADCRIPNPTALIEWYFTELESGADLAYTHVGYIDLPAGKSVKVRMLIHHFVRWFKRNIIGVPTSRGSNYAIKRKLILDLYKRDRISYDIHVGPAVKAVGGKIVYSGEKELFVFTSGRFFAGSWKELIAYLIWRIGYYNRNFVNHFTRPPSSQ